MLNLSNMYTINGIAAILLKKTVRRFLWVVPVVLASLHPLSADAAELTASGRPGHGYAVKSHEIKASIDIKASSLSGTDRITLRGLPAEAPPRLFIRYGSAVIKVEYDGTELPFTLIKNEDKSLNEVRIDWPVRSRDPGAPLAVTVHFHGTFPGTSEAEKNIRRGVAFIDDGIIGEKGVMLPSGSFWYPREEDESALFTAAFDLPEGYTAVTEGEWVERVRAGKRSVDRWRTENPLDGLDLVAARFVVEKDKHGKVRLYTFFLGSDAELSRVYLDKTKGYLDLYEEMIGPYPFRKFAVVENFLPTGYGMPSFTLLGSMVLRLPFIPDTSLGHEIAHSWWGNSVFVDSRDGNWAEALTSYTADYLYEKKKGPEEAAAYRLDQLRKFKSFTSETAVTLKGFTDSTTTESRAVGYAKGMMVFHMLNNKIGQNAFVSGLKTLNRKMAFKRASWKDLENAFEDASGRDLGWFFDQWLERAGGPDLAIIDVTMDEEDSGYTIEFTITQKSPAYTLSLPVVTKSAGGGEAVKTVRVAKEAERVRLRLDERPVSMEVDPDHEVFRLLADSEVPPTLGGCFGDKDGVIIVPDGLIGDRFLDSAVLLSKDYGLKIRSASDGSLREYVKERSVFMLGGPGENALFEDIEDHIYKNLQVKEGRVTVDGLHFGEGGFVAAAVKNPYNASKDLCIFFGFGLPGERGDKEEILKAVKRIRYYTKMSYIVFPAEGDTVKGVFPAESSLSHFFR